MAKSGAIYGYSTQAADAAEYLKEATRDSRGVQVWNNMYDTLDIQEQSYIDALDKQYNAQTTDAANKAYEASHHAVNNTFGVKQSDVQSYVDESLNEAYNQYYQQYLESRNEIEQNLMKVEIK